MDYQNKICDGCGLPLRENEDVVVCPECGTPQHRACFDRNGRCVNEAKHGTGFDWAASAPAAAVNAAVVCPVCRHENVPGAAVCARCGQPFTAEALPPTPAPKRERSTEQLVDDLFFDAPRGVTELQLDDDERDQVEFVLSQRMLQATPGMSEEQAEERLCGHPLRQVMTFISARALTFVNKFRRLESGRTFTWNWAAFLFTPYWFFYRKLWKPGIIVMTIRICLSVAVYTPITRVSELMMTLSEAMRDGSLTQEFYDATAAQIAAYSPVILASCGVVLLLAILSGLLGDRLYHSYVQHTLDRLKEEESRDAFLVNFLRKSAVSPLLAALSYAAVSLIPNFVMSFIVQ